MPLVIGIPVGVLLIMFIAYAIVFLQKHKQKAANAHKTVAGRPPPPARPPPSLPQSIKSSTSPRGQSSNGYYPGQHRYIVRTGTGDHFRTQAGDYRLYDAQAAIPLNSSFLDDRDLYEATPQPYEIDYEHSGVEYYPPPRTGRLQPHPSLYSCR